MTLAIQRVEFNQELIFSHYWSFWKGKTNKQTNKSKKFNYELAQKDFLNSISFSQNQRFLLGK